MCNVPEGLTGIDREKYLEKLAVLHKGACSSPYMENCGEKCPCPMICPLHGRCCDCLTHHKEERIRAKEEGRAVPGEMQWMPNCLRWFDEMIGVGCEPDGQALRTFYETNIPQVPLREKQ